MTDKKNPDYSASAVNLENAPEVQKAHQFWSLPERQVGEAQDAFYASVPQELKVALDEAVVTRDELVKALREAIDQQGSFQDIDAGAYAVQQAKKSQVLHVDPFKEHYPDYMDPVVIETMDKKKLKGLIDGGLIQEADLKMWKVITEDVTYAYIIK